MERFFGGVVICTVVGLAASFWTAGIERYSSCGFLSIFPCGTVGGWPLAYVESGSGTAGGLSWILFAINGGLWFLAAVVVRAVIFASMRRLGR